MKNLSYWGKNNPGKTRKIIAILHILLVFNAFSLATLTSLFDIDIPRAVLLIFGGIFFIAYFLYPSKKTKNGIFKYSYKKQKTLDFLLVVSYFLILSFGLKYTTIISETDHAKQLPILVQGDSPQQDVKNQGEPLFDSKLTFKELRKKIKSEFKELKKELKKQKDKPGIVFLKVFLVILSLAAAIGLGYLIAALACSLSCSGMEGLAVIVLIFGWAGVVLLTVVSIKNIVKKIGMKVDPELEMDS
ncbi:MAG: hypothetical protein ABFS35_14845 [Bacteroidota bacterium]